MFNFKFTRTRKEVGKDTNLDFLTQECVKEAKKIGELLKQDRQSKEEWFYMPHMQMSSILVLSKV